MKNKTHESETGAAAERESVRCKPWLGRWDKSYLGMAVAWCGVCALNIASKDYVAAYNAAAVVWFTCVLSWALRERI